MPGASENAGANLARLARERFAPGHVLVAAGTGGNALTILDSALDAPVDGPRVDLIIDAVISVPADLSTEIGAAAGTDVPPVFRQGSILRVRTD